MAVAIDSVQQSERQYHSTSSAYVLPNDAVEHERLDAQASAIVEMIGGKPFLAPLQSIKQVSKVVDVGCGTGVATIQAATVFPEAKVYGVDLSPIPERVQKIAPTNIKWISGNVLDIEFIKPGDDSISGEVFTPGNLDYVFGRMLFLGISDWSRYFTTLHQSMKPGSIIEHQDLDWKFYRAGTFQCLSDDWEWHRQVVAGVKHAGLSATAGSDAASTMKDLGFQIIATQTFEFSFVPSTIAPDSQAMGRYVQDKLIPNYPELLRKMLAPKGIQSDELDQLIAQCLRDISSEEGIHQKYTVTIAKKL